MKITLSTTSFQGKNAILKLAKKAEKKLQERLVNYSRLMITQEGKYAEMMTGKDFTGKFKISTDTLEQLYHVKNGRVSATLVRDKNGTKKIGGLSTGKIKTWASEKMNNQDKINIKRLYTKISLAQEEMVDNFGIQHCVKNNKTSFIRSRGF